MTKVTTSGERVKRGLLDKEKNVSSGSEFFPFRVHPFSEGKQNNFDRFASPVSVSVLHKVR